jgi:hypothetical protein
VLVWVTSPMRTSPPWRRRVRRNLDRPASRARLLCVVISASKQAQESVRSGLIHRAAPSTRAVLRWRHAAPSRRSPRVAFRARLL